jgi:hypothetical protein
MPNGFGKGTHTVQWGLKRGCTLTGPGVPLSGKRRGSGACYPDPAK